MGRRFLLALAVLGILLLSGGCSSKEIAFERVGGSGAREGTLWKTAEYSPYMDFAVLVGVGSEASIVGRGQSEPVELPEVNFDRDLLIFAYLGEYSSDGYGLKVKKLEKEGQEVKVYVEAYAPTGAASDVMTYPYDLTRVSKESFGPNGEFTFVFIDHESMELGRVTAAINE